MDCKNIKVECADCGCIYHPEVLDGHVQLDKLIEPIQVCCPECGSTEIR